MFNSHRKVVNFSLNPVAEYLHENQHQLTGFEFIALLLLLHCCHFLIEMIRQIMHFMFRTEAN